MTPGAARCVAYPEICSVPSCAAHVTRSCQWCAAEFVPYRAQVFCGKRCRQASDRQKRRGIARPLQMHWNGSGDPACGLRRGETTSTADLAAVTCATCQRAAAALTATECEVDDCGNARYKKHRMCPMHLARRKRTGTTALIDRTPSAEEIAARFWSRVERRGPSECWPWHGSILANGYGRFVAAGKVHGAHRFAYEDAVGPIPVGLAIDHVRERGCNLTSCVNPAHLEPVTASENTRRRHAWERRNAS